MFSRFQVIINNLRANGSEAYDDHERALKLLHALNLREWEVKVAAIMESKGFLPSR
jgi:hypothetical protein